MNVMLCSDVWMSVTALHSYSLWLTATMPPPVTVWYWMNNLAALSVRIRLPACHPAGSSRMKLRVKSPTSGSTPTADSSLLCNSPWGSLKLHLTVKSDLWKFPGPVHHLGEPWWSCWIDVGNKEERWISIQVQDGTLLKVKFLKGQFNWGSNLYKI